jgi:hypothetical protein
MKIVYILKINTKDGFGYFDGQYNWSQSVNDAVKFNSYTEAESFLKEGIELNGWGGMIQIEKYFTNE